MKNILPWMVVAFAFAMVPEAAFAGSGLNLNVKISKGVYCLAQNIYHEARGEPMEGKLAVGHVVMNRMADKRFPKLACSVVKQGGDRHLYRCQFTWWCDGRSDRARNRTAWEESVVIAYLIRAGLTRDPTGGALWYHTTSVHPAWSRHLKPDVTIGRHVFYTSLGTRPVRDRPTLIADASR